MLNLIVSPRSNKTRMYFVYVLKSRKTGKCYVGYTRDVVERLKYHNSGYTKSLRNHVPLEIVRVEEYTLYADARRRERQIKKYKSGEAFKRLLNQ